MLPNSHPLKSYVSPSVQLYQLKTKHGEHHPSLNAALDQRQQ